MPPMYLLPTQMQQIFDVIDDSAFFERHEVMIEPDEDSTILRLRSHPSLFFFAIQGDGDGYDVHMSPGEHVFEVRAQLRWDGLRIRLWQWLEHAKREIAAADRIASSS